MSSPAKIGGSTSRETQPRSMRAQVETRSRRADFPLLAAHPHLHYLDSAATSQKPSVVLDARCRDNRGRPRSSGHR